MLLRTLYTHLGRARGVYDRWVARSYMESVENARLLHAARDEFDRARSVQTDHVPWCARCGERLDDATSVAPREGIHQRCRP